MRFSPTKSFLFWFLFVTKEILISGDGQRFVSTPDKPTKVFIGGNVSLVWRYYKPSHLTLIKVAFGYWKSPGYVYPRMIAVNGTTNTPTVTAGYESAIIWAGNLTNSLAAFVLHDIQPTDRTVDFGIHLEFGYRYNPLRDSVQVKVEQKRDRQRFISTPDKPTKVFIGGNVSLVWRYYKPAHLALIYVAFGYWKSPGYVYPRMIIINGTTNIPQVTAGYETAISWAGNPETSLAAFVVYNIQPTDASVVFGIHLEFGYKYNPLTDLVQIKVEKDDLEKNSMEDKKVYRASDGNDVTNSTNDRGVISRKVSLN